MRFLRDPAQRRYYVPVVLCLALTALLLLLPTGYEGAVPVSYTHLTLPTKA